MRRQLILALLLATTATRASAQELLSLDEMIVAAPSIVVATVESRRAEVEYYGTSRLIITKVTLRVEQTIKGSAPQTLVVEVLGGTLGDTTLRVSHVPEFRVGDRDVLFLSNAAHAVSPLVGSDQGRFRVLADNETGVPRVLTMGFEPLTSLSQIGAARTTVARRMSAALSLNDFVTAVRDRVRTLGVR
jgi:hypothetical protein